MGGDLHEQVDLQVCALEAAGAGIRRERVARKATTQLAGVNVQR
jgi:hypothetical protein